MKKRMKIGIMLVTMLLVLGNVGIVNAGFQANKGTSSKTNMTANAFFEGIRRMEITGGTLGKNANIDTTKEYTDSSNNGIDCHMAKNTEWGTAAMLAASIYGKAPSGSSSASTTGNATGVYQMADGTYEYVAGVYNTTNSYMDKIFNANARYRDLYMDSTTPKPGDATTETTRWYGASYSDFVSSSNPVFGRSYNGLFSYFNSTGRNVSSNGSRAVVVCGENL